MQNLHCSFDRYYIVQIYSGDFSKFCGLIRIYELYHSFEEVLGTIHILRNHIFRIFGPPPPLRNHVFSTENNQKLEFSDPPPPLQVIT